MELDLAELLIVRIALDDLLAKVEAEEPCDDHAGTHALRNRVIEAIEGKDHGAVT